MVLIFNESELELKVSDFSMKHKGIDLVLNEFEPEAKFADSNIKHTAIEFAFK